MLKTILVLQFNKDPQPWGLKLFADNKSLKPIEGGLQYAKSKDEENVVNFICAESSINLEGYKADAVDAVAFEIGQNISPTQFHHLKTRINQCACHFGKTHVFIIQRGTGVMKLSDEMKSYVQRFDNVKMCSLDETAPANNLKALETMANTKFYAFHSEERCPPSPAVVVNKALPQETPVDETPIAEAVYTSKALAKTYLGNKGNPFRAFCYASFYSPEEIIQSWRDWAELNSDENGASRQSLLQNRIQLKP